MAAARASRPCSGTSVKLADEIVERVHARAKENVFAVVLPTDDDVVGPHAVGHVIAAERGRVRQPARLAAFGGNHVNLGVAVVLAGEGEPFAVRREVRKHLVAGMAGEPAGHAAGRGTV